MEKAYVNGKRAQRTRGSERTPARSAGMRITRQIHQPGAVRFIVLRWGFSPHSPQARSAALYIPRMRLAPRLTIRGEREASFLQEHEPYPGARMHWRGNADILSGLRG